jgi:hypothetical protein
VVDVATVVEASVSSTPVVDGTVDAGTVTVAVDVASSASSESPHAASVTIAMSAMRDVTEFTVHKCPLSGPPQTWTRGFIDYVAVVQRHLFNEEFNRRYDYWPVEDAPHGDPAQLVTRAA